MFAINKEAIKKLWTNKNQMRLSMFVNVLITILFGLIGYLMFVALVIALHTYCDEKYTKWIFWRNEK